MKTAFIVNPQSASGRTLKQFEACRPQIESLYQSPVILITQAPKHATELTRQVLANGADLVIAVGGDGTANEVVNGFFERDKPRFSSAAMSVLMNGTGGDLRRTFNWSGEMEAGLHRIKNGSVRKIDVGRVIASNADGPRYFLNVASLGLSALVAENVHKTRGNAGKWSYYLSTLNALLQFAPVTLHVDFDGKQFEQTNCSMMAFANAQYFGGGMQIAPNAQIDDGLMDMVGISNMGLGFFIMHAHRVYAGTHVDLPQVQTARGKVAKVRVTPDAIVLVEADGEPIGRLPATFEIMPNALPFVI